MYVCTVTVSYVCCNKLLTTSWLESNMNLLSHNSGGHKSQRGLTGLKLDVSRTILLFGGSGKESIALPFPASGGCLHALVHASPSIFKASPRSLSLPYPASLCYSLPLSSTSKGLRDRTGPM